MGDLIKIAANGQWTLEKNKKDDKSAAIEQFLAMKKLQGNRPPVKDRMAGLQAAANTAGANPLYSKEQVAAMRSNIPEESKKKVAPVAPAPAYLSDKQKHMARMQGKMQNEGQEADEQGRVAQNKKTAWEATTQFLANKGGKDGGANKGWESINQNLQTKKLLDDAARTGKPIVKPAKPELMPPQEIGTDDSGARVMRPRQGTYANQGAETRGKIVQTKTAFPTKEIGADGQPVMAFGSRAQQEKHHWSWDHDNKKWNHVRTTLGSTNG